MEPIEFADIKAQKVVGFRALALQKVSKDCMAAMQSAMGRSDVADPSVVQRAVATMLDALCDVDDINGWPAASMAINRIGIVMARAVSQGASLKEVKAAVRPIIGA